MPNDLVKSYADKTNKSVDEVEKIWNEAKAQAHDKFGEESDSFWAYVNAIVQKRLGLNESKKLSFSDFLASEHNPFKTC